MSGLRKRSLMVSGHRTSVALEPAFWCVIEAMAADRDLAVAALIAALDAGRDADQPLASALRVAALRWSARAGLIEERPHGPSGPGGEAG
ncbi:hypothetical protein AA103196_0700 [Ameyamaea chiangmaiensis NBRC 103196]|uniref:Ribbon-helix-helix domain-containing protein n=1 Tax=Ameyamaea chiangmaiensis TaxID=442969 RepID=A0A850PF40_9PROT|nr:ribbon-helix-helix domain-containing protein [Ameyamaea chiangmaiensis]MBS4075803.1 ribbon-helix-helix domain-containing protein [Ameyamaea chiangmaiensis]NVN40866.1 ribbon-helix-helix domain-containing protein [Ameyamaea chiangmaiensis]GBQ63795.1 hypothetical protein AA103196_0700 [Ameyamaea chiangmaiensis NBRC 103196]